MPHFSMRASVHGVRSCPSTTGRHSAAPDDDPYLWLEEIEGRRALDFVERQNRLTLDKFGGAAFAADRDTLAAIYDRPDNIPYVTRRGGQLYNLWKDVSNPRGIWRRTTLAEFRKPDPQWETLLDIDRLAADEGADWLLNWTQTRPGKDSRAILGLSRGGSDAVTLREFDMDTKHVCCRRICVAGGEGQRRLARCRYAAAFKRLW